MQVDQAADSPEFDETVLQNFHDRILETNHEAVDQAAGHAEHNLSDLIL